MGSIRALIVTGSLLACGTPAAAQITVNITQSGADVIATTSGTLDISGLIDDDTFFFDQAVWADAGYIATGAGGNVNGYFGFEGPGSFGNGDIINATSGTGDNFAINGSGFGQPYVFVPIGYVSGSAIAGTSLFANTTLAALGLELGTYIFTLPNDTVTVNITGDGAVPEPATWALMIGGFGLVGATMRRKSTKVSYA